MSQKLAVDDQLIDLYGFIVTHNVEWSIWKFHSTAKPLLAKLPFLFGFYIQRHKRVMINKVVCQFYCWAILLPVIGVNG